MHVRAFTHVGLSFSLALACGFAFALHLRRIAGVIRLSALMLKWHDRSVNALHVRSHLVPLFLQAGAAASGSGFSLWRCGGGLCGWSGGVLASLTIDQTCMQKHVVEGNLQSLHLV
jgi:hypothetical protein